MEDCWYAKHLDAYYRIVLTAIRRLLVEIEGGQRWLTLNDMSTYLLNMYQLSQANDMLSSFCGP
jgi:hypothetical protein